MPWRSPVHKDTWIHTERGTISKTTLKPKSTKLTSPVTDIVDAYFIAKWGWEGFVS